jgi:hypothetical protein
MDSTKANHYVSQCCLEGFADPALKEKLWSYSYPEGGASVSVHLVRPAKTAFKNNLYGVDPAHRVQLEELFGVVEGFFPATRERLNSFQPISQGDILVLSLMFCIHLVRNPSWAEDNRQHATNVRSLIQDLPALDADRQDKLLSSVNSAWGTRYSLEEFLAYLASDPSLTRNQRSGRRPGPSAFRYDRHLRLSELVAIAEGHYAVAENSPMKRSDSMLTRVEEYLHYRHPLGYALRIEGGMLLNFVQFADQGGASRSTHP